MPTPLPDPGCARAVDGIDVPAGCADGKRIWLGVRRRERAAALADAGAHAAIDPTAGVGLVAARRSANAAQQRLTPGLHIRLPH